MNQAQQPEALRLAQMLEALGWRSVDKDLRRAAAELRRLHARVQEVEGQQKREPLAAYQRDAIKVAAFREHPIPHYDAEAIIIGTERAHGITAQPEYQTDDERDHAGEDAAIAAGKVQAAVQGRAS